MLSRVLPTLMMGLSIAAAASVQARADETVTYETTLKGNAFTVPEIIVPAGKPFKIKMNNANAGPAELESRDLKIEKTAAGNKSITVRVKAQQPGKYLFFDEYQEDVAKGYVIVH